MTRFDPKPAPALEGAGAYTVERARAPIDLRLDGNEGMLPSIELLDALGPECLELMRSYPDASRLERRLAERHAVDAARVVVTAGADEALDRVCRSLLTDAREILLPSPTFVMIPRYAKLARGRIVAVPWAGGPYPLDEVLARAGEHTAIIAVVTPNNPTGATACAQDLRRLSAAAPGALILLDHAYAEFCDQDLTQVALELPNALVLRTFSKALGLAGLRVGYALGPTQVIAWMRAAGGPYSVSSLSLALTERALDSDPGPRLDFIARIRREREELRDELEALGARAVPSQANFVCARFRDEVWVQEALGGLGIGVRRFPGAPELEGCLRITCPGNERDFERLLHALRSALRPEGLLFDMDGVLADVSGSYRAAILGTAASFGVELTPLDVTRAKLQGHANNDWELTRSLLAERGVEAGLEQVTQRFEALYQGSTGAEGLWRREQLLGGRERLESLARSLPLGIVTGRPRADAERFLERFDLGSVFATMVCLEDAAPKPDPAGVRLALERLGARRAWLVGDTPDDLAAARAAGVVPLGFLAPAERRADADTRAAVETGLFRAGAARILEDLGTLEDLLA